MAFKSEDDAKAYWKENVGIMIKLLIVWFVVSFGCGILFVEELNAIKIGGYKLGFWFAQQGAIYSFVILTPESGCTPSREWLKTHPAYCLPQPHQRYRSTPYSQ